MQQFQKEQIWPDVWVEIAELGDITGAGVRGRWTLVSINVNQQHESTSMVCSHQSTTMDDGLRAI
jgi:hypothetical protein